MTSVMKFGLTCRPLAEILTVSVLMALLDLRIHCNLSPKKGTPPASARLRPVGPRRHPPASFACWRWIADLRHALAYPLDEFAHTLRTRRGGGGDEEQRGCRLARILDGRVGGAPGVFDRVWQGRTEVEQIVTRPYERLIEVIREVERAARDFLGGRGGGRGGGSGRVRDCSCF